MLNMQEIYDRVKTHLLRQRKCAMTDDGVSCVYGNSAGLQCAVGCLIPLEVAVTLPVTGIHRKNSDGKMVWDALLAAGVNVNNAQTCRMLQALQEVHDAMPPHNWETGLRSVAKEFNLAP